MRNMFHLPEPAFESELVSLLFEIERQRASIGAGTTPYETYIELHALFDTVMSVVSARIEGNHTTVYEALDSSARSGPFNPSDHLREILNISETARFIDELDPAEPLTHSLIREIHRRTVHELTREGDPTPGQYREHEVAITGSSHTPPSWVSLHSDMTALLDFVNTDFPLPKQMLQIAVAHHRFVWIHPFSNGNGRVSRLFTYAMLRKTIFADRGSSALNPTAVFGNDRAEYIAALESADTLSAEGTETWATFFALGIRNDLDRVVKLQDHQYVVSQLVGPAIERLSEEGVVSQDVAKALHKILRLGVVKAGDLVEEIPGSAAQRSRVIRQLNDLAILKQSTSGPRFYQLSLSRGPIASRLIRRLDELGFLPQMLADD